MAATKGNDKIYPSTLRYMSLLHLYTPHIRDGNYKHTALRLKGAAEQAKLCRDGVMIG